MCKSQHSFQSFINQKKEPISWFEVPNVLMWHCESITSNRGEDYLVVLSHTQQMILAEITSLYTTSSLSTFWSVSWVSPLEKRSVISNWDLGYFFHADINLGQKTALFLYDPHLSFYKTCLLIKPSSSALQV